MKAKRILMYLTLFILISLTGYGALYPGVAAEEPPLTLAQKLDGAVAVYTGSMFSLKDNELQVIDSENELVAPFLQGDRLMVPIRFIAESFGAKVSWSESDRTADILLDGRSVSIAIGGTAMAVDGKPVVLDTPAVLTGGKTFIPLRAVSEALGKEVFYDRGLAVIGEKAGLFDPAGDKDQIDSVIETVNRLPAVESREKLAQLLRRANESGYGDMILYRDAQKTALPAPAAATANSAADAAGATSYSGTNVQVAGVDEGDMVKTDGAYIYQISGQNLLIAKATPADAMTQAGKITYPEEFRPQALYVRGDQLVVIGSVYLEATPAEGNPAAKRLIAPYYPNTAVEGRVYDLADRSAPKLTRSVGLEGDYLSSRLIEDDLYLVSTRSLWNWQEAEAPLNPWYKDSAVGAEKISVPYDDISYIPPVTRQSYLMVGGLSLDESEKPLQVSSYLGAGEEIYVSQKNLYIAANEGYGGIRPLWMLRDAASGENEEATLLYKFALNNGQTVYQAKGQVPGRILNQFSMDEYNDTFRVATTLGNTWDDTSSNQVYILDATLNKTGSLTDLAKGEKIYSVRFMGNRGYVVTFKKVDPLFVIDLSDAWSPAVLGALKIPGYSDYLHPYDENHLIGFGKDTVTVSMKDSAGKETGVQAFYLGMKAALFDVSDVTNPIEKFSIKIGDRGTESELLSDHKALLFDKEKGILAFPISETKVEGALFDPASGMPNYGRTVFEGAYIYGLNLADGFVLKGKISHLSDADYEKAGYYGGDYEKRIRRILLIDSVLYGVSNGEISAHDSGSLQEISSVLWK